MKTTLRNSLQKYTKTVGERSKVDDIASLALILQKVFGHQVLDPNWSWQKSLISHLIGLFVFTYIAFGTIEALRKTDDVEVKAEAYYTFIMIAILPIKVILFIKNRHVFRDLYITLKTTLYDAIQRNSKAEQVLRAAKKIVYVLFFLVSIPIVNHEFVGLWSYAKGTKISLSRSTDTLMPMEFPYYEIAWAIQTFFLLEIGYTTVILDMWFVLLTLFLCAANDSLVNVLHVERKDGESDISYGIRLNASLKLFYREHVQQTRFLNTMNKMYKWLGLVPLCNAAMCICIILLLLSKDLNWKFAPNFIPMFAEIFAYNYLGENIKTKTKNLNEALINFDWSSLPVAGRRSYYVIITYVQKEFGIKSAMGSDLSLITMTSVLQATYRSFTMLRSVND